jgi:hypothetical protein
MLSRVCRVSIVRSRDGSHATGEVKAPFTHMSYGGTFSSSDVPRISTMSTVA